MKRLSQTRAWYRVERRQSFIKAHELAAWYLGVQQLQSEVLRDYLLLIIYPTDTSWLKIDFKNQSFLCLNGPISLSGTGSNIGQYYIIENVFSDNSKPVIYFYFLNKDVAPLTSAHF